MIMILPAVMIIMGLFSVFVQKELVVTYLGRTSGIKGILLAVFFGALPTGPLYIAFPLAVALRNKGASISNTVIFLSAWACIKIPQELVELQFLGIKFMAARLLLTVIFVALMGIFMERLIEWDDSR
ncbi:MAG: permease [Deltaproteobacteria bacterium]|nr:permease [Deltaproteobacteria bacterium]